MIMRISAIMEKASESLRLFILGADGGNRTHDPEITNHVLWPTELHRQWAAKVLLFVIFSIETFISLQWMEH